MGLEKAVDTSGMEPIISPYFEIISEGIFLYDLETDHFKFSNNALSEITAIDRLEGQDDLLSMIHAPDKEKVRNLLEECRGGSAGVIREIEVRIEKGPGAPHWIEMRCVPMKSQNGCLVAGSIRDVQSLHKAKRDAQFYLDLMTHDLTNKHQVILMNLEILKGLAIEDDDTSRRFGSAVKHLGEAMDTIRSVKVLADVGMGPFEGDQLNLKEEIENGMDILRSFDPLIQIDLEIDIHDDSVNVLADDRLKLVFYHLMANSVIHSNKEVPVVQVLSEDQGDRVKVIIQDNGPGIPDWIKGELQGIKSLDIKKARGRGLGLPLVTSLIDFYGGRMEVQDIIENGSVDGAKVMIYLQKPD